MDCLTSDNRAADWPSIRTVERHPLVAGEGCTIYVLQYKLGQDSERAQGRARQMTPVQSADDAKEKGASPSPNNASELRSTKDLCPGIALLHPKDRCYVFLQESKGRHPERDVLVAMTLSRCAQR
jgi:hypothetical protein